MARLFLNSTLLKYFSDFRGFWSVLHSLIQNNDEINRFPSLDDEAAIYEKRNNKSKFNLFVVVIFSCYLSIIAKVPPVQWAPQFYSRKPRPARHLTIESLQRSIHLER